MILRERAHSFIAVGALCVACLVDLNGQQPSSVAELASLYDKGEHQKIASELPQLISKSTSPKKFDEEVGRAVGRLRSEVAAAFCLEAAIVAYESNEALSMDLVRRGLSKLGGTSDAFALAWHQASVAFAQGPPNPTAVPPFVQTMGQSSYTADVTARRGDDFPKDRGFGMIYAASRRFSKDIEIRFALANYDALRLHNYLYTRNLVLQTPNVPTPTQGTGWRFRKPDFKKLAQPLRELSGLGTSEQRARALLYLGYFLYYDDGTDEALASWAKAQTLSEDRNVKYLALVFRARALWGRKDGLGSAIVALKEARTLYPGAQSATRMLASLQFLLGDTRGASDLVDEMLLSTPTADPWWTFLRGDHDKLSVRLESMRKAIK